MFFIRILYKTKWRIIMPRKQFLLYISFIIFIFSLSGCGKASDSNKDKQKITVTESDNDIENQPDYSEDDIIVVCNYSNYAWGYEQDGWFMDGSGNIYSYDFSNYDYYILSGNASSDYSLMDELKIIQKNSKPTKTCDKGTVNKLYREGIQIDPTADFVYEEAAYDAGQTNTYFHNPETDELILIESNGDTNAIPKDMHARIFSDYINKMSTVSADGDIVNLYTSDNAAVANSHCGYIDGADGMYVLFDKRELQAFKKLTGIDISAMFPDIIDSDDYYGPFIYFVQITNVPTTGYNISYDALLKQGDNYMFIPSKDYSTPDQDEPVGEAMDGFCTVAVISDYNDNPQDYDYLSWNGQAISQLDPSDILDVEENGFAMEFPKEAAGDYYFSSGVGGWGTTLTVYEDGTFDAYYHDSNMGESGDGYDGTTYIGNCYGRFIVDEKQSDYIYKMSIEITGHSTTDEEFIETYDYNGTEYRERNVYSDVYGLDGGTTFMLYLEGVQTSELPEGFITWMAMPRAWGEDTPETLPFNGIYNVEEDCGFGQ